MNRNLKIIKIRVDKIYSILHTFLPDVVSGNKLVHFVIQNFLAILLSICRLFHYVILEGNC